MQMLHDKKVYGNVKSEGISNKDVVKALRWFIQTGMLGSVSFPRNTKHRISPLKWPRIYLLSVLQSQLELISLSLIPNQRYRQDNRCIDLMTVSITAAKPPTGEEQIAAMEICAVFTIWFDFSVARGERL